MVHAGQTQDLVVPRGDASIAVSRSLATLERSVAVALVRRTTRQPQPTEVGLAFYRVKLALTEISDARRVSLISTPSHVLGGEIACQAKQV